MDGKKDINCESCDKFGTSYCINECKELKDYWNKIEQDRQETLDSIKRGMN